MVLTIKKKSSAWTKKKQKASQRWEAFFVQNSVMAGQNVIMYNRIPEEMQGRVFAVRNAIQFCTIPVGILLGGFLADYVFEPFMKSGVFLSDCLALIVGKSEGNGMAVMFLITGFLGFLVSCFSYRIPEIRKLDAGCFDK